MVEDIGRLRANLALAQGRRGDREFDRFFAEFARAMGGATIQQAAGIGRLSARAGALVDRLRKRVQRESRATPVVLTHFPLSLVTLATATGRAASAHRRFRRCE